MSKTVSLLTYADRFGGTVDGLRELMARHAPQFTGVHLLPFFHPFDGADAGFDPIDHAVVDPRLGDWSDVTRLGETVEVTADLIVNHTSSQSPEFLDWLEHGADSAYEGLYLTFDRVFPNGARSDEITAFYRPRPGLPFTAFVDGRGRRRLVWTTFLPSQVDIDVTHPAGRGYLRRLLDILRANGVATVRLDAIGYAIKSPGSDSFMTADTLGFVRELTAMCHARDLTVLVEVHAHYSAQLEIARHVDHIYDFALPPLLLHAWDTGSTDELSRWLAVRPETAVSVLDTHDGIGVVDACRKDPSTPGFLTEQQAADIFDMAAETTGGQSAQFSIVPQFAPRPHQINSTFASVLGGDLTSLIAMRAVQLLLPGPAHVYYVGLLGGLNDTERALATGVGREINRHDYAPDELDRLWDSPVVRATLALVRLATTHPAMEGEFAWRCHGDRLALSWTASEHALDLTVQLGGRRATFELTVTSPDGTETATTFTQLAAYA